MSSWATWTQDLVPQTMRGPFFAWRNIAGFASYAAVAWLVGLIWPEVEPEDEELWWYVLLFALVSIPCLLSTAWLAAAPGLSDHARERSRELRPMGEALRGKGPFWVYAAWNLLHALAMSCTLLFIPDLIRGAAVGGGAYASTESWTRSTGMLAGILIGGALLRRIGCNGMLLLMNLFLAGGLVAYLLLEPGNAAWLLPIALVVESLGRGITGIAWMSRLYEVVPTGDPRFPALFLGMGALAMTLLALAIPGLADWLKANHPGLEVAWVLVAAGCGLRLISLPLLLDRRRLEVPEQDD